MEQRTVTFYYWGDLTPTDFDCIQLSNCNLTFGNSAHTIVTVRQILDEMGEMSSQLHDKLCSIGGDTFIDLEN